MAGLETDAVLFVTAVICTAGRAGSIRTAVGALLASAYRAFEVIVVDQSDDATTEDALSDLRSDDRLRYLHPGPIGKAAALNVGLSEGRGEILACTDDDCVVAADWLERIVSPFSGRPRVAVVFGRVDPAPHDSNAGFIPAYAPVRDRERTTLIGRAPNGMGASMAVRKSAIVRIGGFDPAIGPGGAFRSGDDRDIAIRALLAGFSIYDAAGAVVVHHGFRTFREGREHAHRAWYGMGAICAKPLKARRPEILFVAADLFILRAVGPAVMDVLHWRRPRGLTRIASFVAGFARGLATPLRTDALVFDLPPRIAGQGPAA